MPHNASKKMIELKEVSKIYYVEPEVRAVDRVSFDVKERETVVLLGTSGCGKTTTMKLINRLIEPTSGQIFVDGVLNTDVDPIELRRNIGYVIQQIGLFPHMTIAENIALVPRLKGWAKMEQRKRAEELLELVHLDPTPFADRYPVELSGGQRQRVGVARALAADPPIVLMDEPFGALDPITRERIQEEFAQLEAIIHKTILFVTHDVFEAVSLGDRIAIMEAGKIVQIDPPMQLLTQPKNDFVSDFFGKHRFQLQFNSSPVEQIMHSDPLTFKVTSPRQSTSEFLALVEKQDEEEVFAIDPSGQFLGIISQAEAMASPNVSVTTMASERSIAATMQENLGNAVETMRKHRLSKLPVVDAEGRLIGVLRSADLADALVGNWKQVENPDFIEGD